MAIRKKFIEVEIPMIKENISVLGTPESLNKKTIKLDMSRKLRGKNLEISFQILNPEGALKAFPKKMVIMLHLNLFRLPLRLYDHNNHEYRYRNHSK